MSKKRLDTTAIMSELSGGSAFFPNYKREEAPSPAPAAADEAIPPDPAAVTERKSAVSQRRKGKAAQSGDATTVPRHHDTMVPRHQGTTIPQTEEAIYEAVRRAVKQIGKEAATHRFTEAEKGGLRDIEYAYRREGIRTSENELTRIAINYLIEDHRKNGEGSILATVLRRLNS